MAEHDHGGVVSGDRVAVGVRSLDPLDPGQDVALGLAALLGQVVGQVDIDASAAAPIRRAVDAVAAIQRVGALVADQDVIARPAEEGVVAPAGVDVVGPVAPEDGVRARPAAHGVVARARGDVQPAAVGPADHAVGAIGQDDPLDAREGDRVGAVGRGARAGARVGDGDRPGQAREVERVGAVAAEDRVGAEARLDDEPVVAVAARQHVVIGRVEPVRRGRRDLGRRHLARDQREFVEPTVEERDEVVGHPVVRGPLVGPQHPGFVVARDAAGIGRRGDLGAVEVHPQAIRPEAERDVVPLARADRPRGGGEAVVGRGALQPRRDRPVRVQAHAHMAAAVEARAVAREQLLLPVQHVGVEADRDGALRQVEARAVGDLDIVVLPVQDRGGALSVPAGPARLGAVAIDPVVVGAAGVLGRRTGRVLEVQQDDGRVRGPGAGQERVVARAPVERVVAGAALQRVVAVTAKDAVVAAVAAQEVGPRLALQRILARAAVERIVARAAHDHV